MTPLRFALVAAILPACGIAPAAEPSIPELIQRLQSDQFREREAAQKALMPRDDVAPYLRRSLSTLDAEGRRRAKVILEEIRHRRTKTILKYARDGRVDLLVEWSALAGDRIDPETLWQCVLDVSWECLKQSLSSEEIREWEKSRLPGRKFADFLSGRPTFINSETELQGIPFPQQMAVRSRGKFRAESMFQSMILATGPVKVDGLTNHVIIIATGDVTATFPDKALIITDGDVDLGMPATVVVAARGSFKVSISSQLRRCVIRADRGVNAGMVLKFAPDTRRRRLALPNAANLLPAPPGYDGPQYDLLLRPSTPLDRDDDPPIELRVGVPADWRKPANSSVRFFENSDVGLEVAIGESGPEVKSLRSGCPLLKAGLKAGDIILTVDGTEIRDANAMRRQLRRAFVLGGAELNVRRGDQILSLDVSFVGWELPAGKPLLPK